MKNKIEYTATVGSVNGENVTFVMDGCGDACGGCAVSRMCSQGESGELTMAVTDASRFAKGERVKLSAPESLRWRAIALLLMAPMGFSLLAAALSWMLSGSDGIVALSVLLVGVIYFVGLYMCRGRLTSTYGWKIEKL